MNESTILKCENLTKIYGNEDNKTIALDDVSFSVKKGQFVSIIGASGSGKSTLLHLLGGVDKPTSGKVIINNIDIHQLIEDQLAEFRRKEIGIIYQFYNLIPTLNVEENIILPIELDRKKIDTKKLDEIIKFLGLEKRKKHLPNELSGGQQQKVAIGRALMINPTIILADDSASFVMISNTVFPPLAPLYNLNDITFLFSLFSGLSGMYLSVLSSHSLDTYRYIIAFFPEFINRYFQNFIKNLNFLLRCRATV